MRNLIVLLFTMVTSVAANAAGETIANEAPITFTASSGESVEAYTGHFMVRENRVNPSSQLRRVNYVRFPATGTANTSPIVYLAGGPGGSGIATAQGPRFSLFMAMREFGDVIALDQRGTGDSEQAPECASGQQIELGSTPTEAHYIEQYRKAALECMTFWQQQGFDTHGYTTLQSAYDLDDLRVHLGAKRLTLWGISYGTHLALAASKIMGDKLEKMILASAEGLDQTVKLPAQTDAYFARVQAILDQQTEQPLDLLALMRANHKKLTQSPLEVSFTGRSGVAQTMLFRGYHLQMLGSMMIADPNRYLSTLIALHQTLAMGNSAVLQQVLSFGMFTSGPIRLRLMSMAMDIASGISAPRKQLVELQAKEAVLGSWLNFPMPQLANVDSQLVLPDAFRQESTASVPTLLFSGTLDGRTYPAEQAIAVAGLTNLTQITVVNAGHNLFSTTPEVLATMQRFMRDASIDATQLVLPEPKLLN